MPTHLPPLGTMLIAAVITVWMGGWVAPAFAEPVPMALTRHKDGRCPAGKFPASGQTTAYQADINDGTSDNFVDIPDDGTLEAGATLRYRDNGDGTITDRNTRLTWEKKSDDGGLHDKDNSYTWSGGLGATVSGDTVWDWLEDVNTENGVGFAGHDDWRIPNVKELQSIVNYEIPFPGPAVSTAFDTACSEGCTVETCSCTASFGYFSSTTDALVTTLAWFVGFSLGNVDRNEKTAPLHVRAVRGGCQ
jgi:hypothetical protein